MRRLLSLGLVSVLVCALVFSPALAAAPTRGAAGGVVSGGCTESDLDTALAHGGTVTFSCGGPKTITLTSQKVIALNTIIDGGGLITLTGNMNTRLFSVNSGAHLTLQHLVLDQGYSNTGNGGAIVNHGTLTLAAATIQYSETDFNHSGGAIFSDGPVFITASTLQFNISGSGGALYANTSAAHVQIDGSTFINNQALDSGSGFGGAIWAGPNAQVALANTLFNFNDAQYGGALYISTGAAVTVSGSPTVLSFFDNTAYLNGGAINNQAGGLLTTSGVLLQQNLATTGTAGVGSGGAIYTAGPLVLHDTYFKSNSGRLGGAIRVDGPTTGTLSIVLDRNAFVSNFAQVSGGGLYLSGAGSLVSVMGSLVDANTAMNGAGGGIARVNARLTVRDSSVISNVASNAGGGGLWATVSGGPSNTGGVVQVLDSTITQNSAQSSTQGGGIYNNGAQINLRNDTIVENVNGTFNTGPGVILSTTNSVYWNDGSLNCDDTGPGIISLGGNYSSDNSCDFSATGDTTDSGIDPLQGRTIDHLDSIQAVVFYLPKPGSSIINTALPVCSPRDQRGALRPDACDKGAVELGGLLPRLFASLVGR